MCRAIVAARLTDPDREWAVFRALQVAQFTTTLDLETTEGIAAALARVPGLDVAAVLEAAASPETEAAFEADRDEARTAAGSPTEFQGKSATTPDGRVRYTAPSLVFDGRGRAGGSRPAASSRPRPTTCWSPTSTRRCAAARRRRTRPRCSPRSRTASRPRRSPP